MLHIPLQSHLLQPPPFAGGHWGVLTPAARHSLSTGSLVSQFEMSKTPKNPQPSSAIISLSFMLTSEEVLVLVSAGLFLASLGCLLVVLVLLTGQISPFTGLHLTTCVERKRRCASGTLWCNGSASDSSWEGCMFNSCWSHPKASSVSAFKVNLGVLSYKLMHRNYVFQKTCQSLKMYSCWLN